MPLTYGNGSAACDGHTFIMTLPAFLQGYALRNKLVGGRMAHAKRFNGEFRGRSLIFIPPAKEFEAGYESVHPASRQASGFDAA